MNQYRMADLNFNFDSIEYEYFQTRMSEYTLSDIQSCCDVNISYSNNDNIILPKGVLYKRIHKWNWAATEDKYVAYQIHPITKENVSLIEADKEWKCVNFELYDFENDCDITNNHRSFAGAGEIFAYSILKHNGLVLHSSAIDYNNNAILFSAPSGTGKSTHTELWCKYYGNQTRIINDDTPAIRFINNVPYAYGIPWSGKTQINVNCSIPLRAIVFLERSNENRIRQIKGFEAVSRMLSETRKPVFPKMMDLCLDIIDKIISRTPIYVLSCDISRNAVDLVKSTLDL